MIAQDSRLNRRCTSIPQFLKTHASSLLVTSARCSLKLLNTTCTLCSMTGTLSSCLCICRDWHWPCCRVSHGMCGQTGEQQHSSRPARQRTQSSSSSAWRSLSCWHWSLMAAAYIARYALQVQDSHINANLPSRAHVTLAKIQALPATSACCRPHHGCLAAECHFCIFLRLLACLVCNWM